MQAASSHRTDHDSVNVRNIG